MFLVLAFTSAEKYLHIYLSKRWTSLIACFLWFVLLYFCCLHSRVTNNTCSKFKVQKKAGLSSMHSKNVHWWSNFLGCNTRHVQWQIVLVRCWLKILLLRLVIILMVGIINNICPFIYHTVELVSQLGNYQLTSQYRLDFSCLFNTGLPFIWNPLRYL